MGYATSPTRSCSYRWAGRCRRVAERWRSPR
jgi:hypothetical protein